MTNQVKGFEARKSTGVIPIDLQEDFDILSHGIPSIKLEFTGILPENKTSFANFDKRLSKPRPLNYTVNQRSILGLILFYYL